MEIGYTQGTIGAMQRNKARQEPGTRKERKGQRDVGKLNVAVATGARGSTVRHLVQRYHSVTFFRGKRPIVTDYHRS